MCYPMCCIGTLDQSAALILIETILVPNSHFNQFVAWGSNWHFGYPRDPFCARH